MAIVGGPLTGTVGNDFLLGDAFELGGGDIDNYANIGETALRGLDGDDVLVGDLFDPFTFDTEGDEIFGGDGNDTIYGDTAPDLSFLGISSPWIGDSLWDRRLAGSADKLYGDAGNDTIYGGGGGDWIYGGTGNDSLHGQSGSDWIEGNQGRDRIYCGDGNDTSYGGAGNDTMYGGAGNDNLYGEAYGTSAGDGGDTIRGGGGGDDIRGGAGADRLYGEAGDDWIIGGGLSSDATNDLGDFCSGGGGDDIIDGRFGNDTIIGGAGADRLTGGADADFFVYLADSDSRRSAPDIITDFDSAGIDKIDLSAIDAIAGGLDDAFVFRGGAKINDIGQLRVFTSGGNTFIDINLSGTAAAEMRIQLSGIVTLDAADFIL